MLNSHVTSYTVANSVPSGPQVFDVSVPRLPPCQPRPHVEHRANGAASRISAAGYTVKTTRQPLLDSTVATVFDVTWGRVYDMHQRWIEPHRSHGDVINTTKSCEVPDQTRVRRDEFNVSQTRLRRTVGTGHAINLIEFFISKEQYNVKYWNNRSYPSLSYRHSSGSRCSWAPCYFLLWILLRLGFFTLTRQGITTSNSATPRHGVALRRVGA